MRCILTRAALGVLLSSIPVPSSAQWVNYPTPGIPRTQDGKPNLKARAPKTRDGKPDLSGIWEIEYPKKALARFDKELVGPNLLDFMPDGAEIPLQPAAASLFQQRSEKLGAGRPSEHCLPHGIPDAMTVGQFKLVQTPGLTLILYEEFNHYRQIFTDGRPFPKDLNPAWFGSSIGKWDGNTFVIESQGFNDRSWLDDYGLPHTDALHTTERFQRLDLGRLNLRIIIDDLKAYTKPWSVDLHFKLLPDTDLIEDVCDNEKDVQHASGRP
jgi:hypothetical protein